MGAKQSVPEFTGPCNEITVRNHIKNTAPEKINWHCLVVFDSARNKMTNQVNGEYTSKVKYTDLKDLRHRVMFVWPENMATSIKLMTAFLNEGRSETYYDPELMTAGLCAGSIIQGREVFDRLTNPARLPPPKVVTYETVKKWLEDISYLSNYPALVGGLDAGMKEGRARTASEVKTSIKGTAAEIKKKLENAVNLTGLCMLNSLNSKFIMNKTTGYGGAVDDVKKIGFMLGTQEVALRYALTQNVQELNKDDLDVLPHFDTIPDLVKMKEKADNGGGSGIPDTVSEPTFMETYKWWLIGGVAVIVVAGVGVGIATA